MNESMGVSQLLGSARPGFLQVYVYVNWSWDVGRGHRNWGVLDFGVVYIDCGRVSMHFRCLYNKKELLWGLNPEIYP